MIFVAEIGSCHKGKHALAYEMIRQSALAGADIVKFQLGHHDGIGEAQRMRRWPTKNAEFLMKSCNYWDVEFMASIFSTEGLEIAKEIGQSRYKFASREAFEKHSKEDYKELLLKVLELGRITYVSDTTTWPFANARTLHCVPCYPTYPRDLAMPKDFVRLGYYGYSTHVHGIEDALLAITRGAKLIEKHVTLDKTEESIKDNHFALSFDEFAEMVRIGRQLEKLTKHCNSIG